MFFRLDCVLLVHHHIYEEANILHRDLSDSNIMFRRPSGMVIGVLCDLIYHRTWCEKKKDSITNRRGVLKPR